MKIYVLTDYTRRPTVRHLAYMGGHIAECNYLTVAPADEHAHYWAKYHPNAAPIDYDHLPMCKRCARAKGAT